MSSVDLAQRMLLQNEFSQAQEIFETLSSSHPEDNGLKHNLALSLEMQGKTVEAMAIYGDNLKNNMMYIKSHLGFYNCLRQLNVSKEERLKFILRTIEIAESSEVANCIVQATLLLSEAYFCAGQLDYNDEAIATYLKASELVEKLEAKHTSHYVQCYYENFNNSIYYMLHPPKLHIDYDIPHITTDLVICMIATSGYTRMLQNCIASISQNCKELLRYVHVMCLDQYCFDHTPPCVYKHKVCSLSQQAQPIRLYNETSFNQIVNCKIRMTGSLLKKGHRVLWSDLDVVFLANPLPFVNHPLMFQKDLHDRACTGFFYVEPNNVDLFDERYHPPSCGDQPVVNYLLKARRIHFHFFDDRFLIGTHAGSKGCHPVIIHYNNILGHDKIYQMKTHGDWFLDQLSDAQHKIIEETERFRLIPHSNSGYNGPWIEQAFFHHFIRDNNSRDSTKALYIPIYWTELLLQDIEKYQSAKQYVEGLNISAQYFTLVQHADGLSLPSHVQVFASGRPLEKQVTIPLLKRCLQPGKASDRTIKISFCGNVTSFNNPQGIRTKLMDFCSEHFDNHFTKYSGPGWESVMRKSAFSLCPRGYGPTSFRLCESIQCLSIPIVVWEDEGPVLPYTDLIDWNTFSITVNIRDILTLPDRLAQFDHERAINELHKVRHMFSYEYCCNYINSKRCLLSSTPTSRDS